MRTVCLAVCLAVGRGFMVFFQAARRELEGFAVIARPE